MLLKETRYRSLLKMLSWRACATIATMILVYLFVGKVKIAVSVGIVEVFLKMALYYLHERVWDKVKIGKCFQGVPVI